MTGLGQTETSRQRDGTACLPSKADIFGDCRHGRSVPFPEVMSLIGRHEQLYRTSRPKRALAARGHNVDQRDLPVVPLISFKKAFSSRSEQPLPLVRGKILATSGQGRSLVVAGVHPLIAIPRQTAVVGGIVVRGITVVSQRPGRDDARRDREAPSPPSAPTGNSQSWAPNNAQSGPPSATANGVGAAADGGSANAVATADPDRTTVAADVGRTEPATADGDPTDPCRF
jgi:hypothetical protein